MIPLICESQAPSFSYGVVDDYLPNDADEARRLTFEEWIDLDADTKLWIIASAGYWKSDEVSINVLTAAGQGIGSFNFDVPEDSNQASLTGVSPRNGHKYADILPYLPQALGALALMGFGVIRWFKREGFDDYERRLIRRHEGRTVWSEGYCKNVIACWHPQLQDEEKDFDQEFHPEEALRSSKAMIGHDSGYWYSGDKPMGSTWALVYGTPYDELAPQINMGVFLAEFRALDPDELTWDWHSVSGIGRGYPTGHLLCQVYDDRGALTPVMRQALENLAWINSGESLDNDALTAAHHEHLIEYLAGEIRSAHLRGNLSKKSQVNLPEKVYQYLSDQGLDLDNSDDPSLTNGQILAALRDLKVLRVRDYDEDDFDPYGWSELRKKESLRWEARQAQWARERQ